MERKTTRQTVMESRTPFVSPSFVFLVLLRHLSTAVLVLILSAPTLPLLRLECCQVDMVIGNYAKMLLELQPHKPIKSLVLFTLKMLSFFFLFFCVYVWLRWGNPHPFWRQEQKWFSHTFVLQ